MSQQLESLLDVARRRDCEMNDAAFKEMVMKHHTDSPRTLSRQIQVDVSGEMKDYHFTFMRPGQWKEEFHCTAPDGAQAFFKAKAIADERGAIVIPREDCQEQSEEMEYAQ